MYNFIQMNNIIWTKFVGDIFISKIVTGKQRVSKVHISLISLESTITQHRFLINIEVLIFYKACIWYYGLQTTCPELASVDLVYI